MAALVRRLRTKSQRKKICQTSVTYVQKNMNLASTASQGRNTVRIRTYVGPVSNPDMLRSAIKCLGRKAVLG